MIWDGVVGFGESGTNGKGGRNVEDAGRQRLRFDSGVYDRAHAEVGMISERLPRAAVADLAQEVVARLAARARARPDIQVRLSDDDIDALSHALIADDKDAGARMIATALDQGVPVETLYLGHLAPAAQRLGEWWEKDDVSYSVVMLAAARIYAIMLGLRRSMTTPYGAGKRAAVFASVPGDTHTLGVIMASDLLRNKGWDIDLKVGRTHEALVEELVHSDRMVIGLSAGSKRSFLPLIRLIVALRVSKPGVRIMVSGQIAAMDLDLVGAAGADASAAGFDDALSEMERLAALT